MTGVFLCFKVVEDEVLELIADQLRGKEWRRLARCLGLTERTLEEIDKNHCSNLRGCCRDMMMNWKNEKGPDALGFILAGALHKAELRQLAERYVQL